MNVEDAQAKESTFDKLLLDGFSRVASKGLLCRSQSAQGSEEHVRSNAEARGLGFRGLGFRV